MPLIIGTRRALITPTPKAIISGGAVLLRRYVASSGTNTTVNGTAVTSWADTVVGATLTPINGNGSLTYKSAGPNGKPSIVSTGIDSFQEAAFDAAINTADVTVVAVVMRTEDTLNYPYYANCYDGANHGWLLPAYQSPVAYGFEYGTGTAVGGITGASVAKNIWSKVIGIANHTTPLERCIVNGTTATDAATSYSANTTAKLVIGEYGGVRMEGEIAEFRIYDQQLTSTELTALDSDLYTEYAV